MTLTDVLKNVVLPVLTLATTLGMLYVTWLLFNHPTAPKLSMLPCLLIAGVSGYFNYLDGRKIYGLLSK